MLPDHAELAVLEQGQREVIGDGLISSSLAGPAQVTAIRWPNKGWSRPVLPDHAELAAWERAQLAAARARRGWRPISRALTSQFNKRTHRRRPGDISLAPLRPGAARRAGHRLRFERGARLRIDHSFAHPAPAPPPLRAPSPRPSQSVLSIRSPVCLACPPRGNSRQARDTLTAAGNGRRRATPGGDGPALP